MTTQAQPSPPSTPLTHASEQRNLHQTFLFLFLPNMQGVHHADTHGAPERMRRPERLELPDLYGPARQLQDAGQCVQQLVQRTLRARAQPTDQDLDSSSSSSSSEEGQGDGEPPDTAMSMDDSDDSTSTAEQADEQAGELGPGLTPAALQLLGAVRERGTAYGAAHRVMVVEGQHAGGGDEECERELQHEQQRQQETEVQIEKADVCAERDWDWAAGARACSIPEFGEVLGAAEVQLLPLPDALSSLQLCPASISTLPWSQAVHVTSNFLCPVKPKAGCTGNEYLRPVDAVLLFPNAGGALAVLLSPREAAGVLHAMQQSITQPVAPVPVSQRPSRPVLTSLCYLVAAFRQQCQPYLARSMGSHATATGVGGVSNADLQLGAEPLVSMSVFNGEARFSTAHERGPLVALVKHRLQDVQALLRMRGKSTYLPCSDLEAACKGLLLH